MKNQYLAITNNVHLIDNYLYPRVIVLSDKASKVLPINSTGICFLSLCDGMHKKDEIISIVSDKYSINQKVVEEDANEFFKKMIINGIVELLEKYEYRKVNIFGSENILLPFQLSIEVTNQCQLKCKHCYNKSAQKREDELCAEELIDILKQYKELGGTSVMLTGGELFIKNDILKILDYVGENFFRISILSNAYTISRDIMDRLYKFKDKISIQVSLDGMHENHDYVRGIQNAFNVTFSNIEKMVSFGIDVSIGSTITENNVDDLYELTRKVKSIGCSSISVGIISPIGRAKKSGGSSFEIIKNLNQIVNDVREELGDDTFSVGINIEDFDERLYIDDYNFNNKCGAGFKILHVFSNGLVGFCPMHGSIIDKFTLGNLRSTKLKDLLDYNNFKYVLDIPSPTKEYCDDCKYLVECDKCIISMLNHTEEECMLLRSIHEKKVIN